MQFKSSVNSQLRWLGGAVLAAMAFHWLSSGLQSEEAQRPTAPRQSANRPQYTEQGELKLPSDFETWVFVGANLGIEYRDAGANAPAADKDKPKPPPAGKFHNI